MLRTKRCTKCGSTPVVHAKEIPDHHGNSVGAIRLAPQSLWSLLSQGLTRSALQLCACPACGYAELYVDPNTPWADVAHAEFLTADP